MGMTILEKIFAQKSGRGKPVPGDIVVVDVDLSVFIDSSFMKSFWRDVLKVVDPDRIAVIFDHNAPAQSPVTAGEQMRGRDFVRRFGIKRFHDIGRDLGISHTVIAEQGYALPGTVLICMDSHTCSGGAYNCAARGVGPPDMIHAITTGKTWFRMGETIRYDLEGELSPGVTPKDVFFHLAWKYGDHAGQNLEFGGSALSSLSLDARRTIATMAAEVSAEFATFEADSILLDDIRKRNAAPFEAQYPDRDAIYRDRRTIELGKVEPLVAKPDNVVGNLVPVSEVAGQPIQQAFIGSCANGGIEDIAAAAGIVAGRRVAPGVRFIVTPASQGVYREALRAGYVETLVDAGAIVTNATCGACGGGHMGVLGPGEVCITASTRNFKGRMGDPSAKVYIGSPLTVAASAITGVISHPRDLDETRQ